MAAIARRLRDIIAERRPALIMAQAYEGGHPDHDAACFAVHSACRLLERAGQRPPELVEMSSYFGRHGIRVTSSFLERLPPPTRVQLHAASLESKMRMLGCYATQAQTVSLFTIAQECFRLAPAYDFSRPPHDGRLFYEFFGLGITGEQWRRQAALALEELGLAEKVA